MKCVRRNLHERASELCTRRLSIKVALEPRNRDTSMIAVKRTHAHTFECDTCTHLSKVTKTTMAVVVSCGFGLKGCCRWHADKKKLASVGQKKSWLVLNTRLFMLHMSQNRVSVLKSRFSALPIAG